MLPAPSAHQTPSLVPAPRSACLCFLPFTLTVRSPLFRPRPAPSSMSTPGEFARRGSLCAYVPLPRPPLFFFQILGSSGPWFCCRVDFRARARGQGASTPWQLLALALAYEVVVFQPRTVTPPHLGSVAIVTTIIYGPPAPPDSTVFLDGSFPSSILPPPPSAAVHCRSPLYVCTHSPPPLPARSAAHLNVARTRQPPPLISSPRATCLRLPPFPVTVRPPLCRPRPAPRSLSAPGGFARRGSPRLPCAPALPFLISPPNPRIFWFLVSCRVDFRARARGQGASTPWQLLALALAYEVVVFQPRTVTPPHLGSVAIVTTIIYGPPAPPDSTVFLDGSFPSSILPPPPSAAVHCRSPLYVCTHSPPPLPARSAAHLNVARTRQPPPLISSPRATCLRLPPFPVTVRPPLCRPRPAPRSLSAPGGFARRGSPRLPCAPALPFLISPPNPRIFWFLVSCRVDFRARARGQGASTP